MYKHSATLSLSITVCALEPVRTKMPMLSLACSIATGSTYHQ